MTETTKAEVLKQRELFKDYDSPEKIAQLDEKVQTDLKKVFEEKKSLDNFLKEQKESFDILSDKIWKKFFIGYIEASNRLAKALGAKETTKIKAEKEPIKPILSEKEIISTTKTKELTIETIQKLKTQRDNLMQSFQDTKKMEKLWHDSKEYFLTILKNKAQYNSILESYKNDPGMFSYFTNNDNYKQHFALCNKLEKELNKIEAKKKEVTTAKSETNEISTAQKEKVEAERVEAEKVEAEREFIKTIRKQRIKLKKYNDNIVMKIKLTSEDQQKLNNILNREGALSNRLEWSSITASTIRSFFPIDVKVYEELRNNIIKIEKETNEKQKAKKLVEKKKREKQEILERSPAYKAVQRAKKKIRKKKQTINKIEEINRELEDRRRPIEAINDFIKILESYIRWDTGKILSAEVLWVEFDKFDNITRAIEKLGWKIGRETDKKSIAGKKAKIISSLGSMVDVKGNTYDTRSKVRKQLILFRRELKKITKIDQTTDEFKKTIITLINEKGESEYISDNTKILKSKLQKLTKLFETAATSEKTSFQKIIDKGYLLSMLIPNYKNDLEMTQIIKNDPETDKATYQEITQNKKTEITLIKTFLNTMKAKYNFSFDELSEELEEMKKLLD